MSSHIVSNYTNSISTNYIDDVVTIEHVSVQYRIPSERIGTFREYLIRLIQKKIAIRTFNALNDVSMSVKKGEVFGIIGDNGAGKSTLLKVVARVLRPQKGKVIIRGKVAPLLEMGAGFHPELTGRENIYLNGSLLGYSREQMEDVFPEIVAFSELGDFIDAPIRSYSSGMYARLGFSVATANQPEILIVDESLAVGDEAFKEKCYERINKYEKGGASILYVSHDMDTIIKMCNRVAWLDQGNVNFIGKPEEVVKEYRRNHQRT